MSKKSNENYQIRNIAFWILIVFIFFLGFYVIHYIKTGAIECMSNSGAYQIKLLEKANNSTIECSCSSNGNWFYIDNKGISTREYTSSIIDLYYNISDNKTYEKNSSNEFIEINITTK
jgi:hypothetical protein